MRPRQTRRRSVHGRLAEYSWIGCAAVLWFARAAVAAPPPNPDPQLAPWFKELSRAWRPGSGATVKCCDIADCRVTDYREIADHYEVLIDGRFPGVLVPPGTASRPRPSSTTRTTRPAAPSRAGTRARSC